MFYTGTYVILISTTDAYSPAYDLRDYFQIDAKSFSFHITSQMETHYIVEDTQLFRMLKTYQDMM